MYCGIRFALKIMCSRVDEKILFIRRIGHTNVTAKNLLFYSYFDTIRNRVELIVHSGQFKGTFSVDVFVIVSNIHRMRVTVSANLPQKQLRPQHAHSSPGWLTQTSTWSRQQATGLNLKSCWKRRTRWSQKSEFSLDCFIVCAQVAFGRIV